MSYTANGLNQYTAAGATNFTYDANGNLAGDGTWVYTYDGENHLIHATGAGKDVTLRYDPLGRLWKVAGSNIGDVTFLYDGDALVSEFSSAGTMTNRYVHGSNAAADDPLVRYVGSAVGSSNRHYFHADHEGSIVAQSDGTGANVAINTYDEYGIPGSTNDGRFGYTGQTYLYEIGLDYYKARIYSPTLGRFLQTDPIGYDGGENLYAYVEDDPVDRVGPTGNYVCDSSGSGPQSCKAVDEAYARDQDALKSGSLTESQRNTIKSVLHFLGKPSEKNGVTISFASADAISAREGNRLAEGYTEPDGKGGVHITLTDHFSKLYDNVQGKKILDRDYSGVSAQDEKGAILLHEGTHVEQYRNGMTTQEYGANRGHYEDLAYKNQKLINRAYGSVPVYDVGH